MNLVSSCRSRRLVRLVRKFSFSHLVVLVVLLLGVAFLTTAQEATIVGTVTDPSGSVVPNVTITITNVKTGVSRSLNTNDVGQYVAPGLTIGIYDLKAEASGFKVEESKGVTLNVNDRIRVDFQMKMGTKAETISVESNALRVQTDSSEQSSLVTGTQITELATNGRSLYTYVSLTPGASNLNPDFQVPTSVGASNQISFNGSRPSHNLYMLDGGENDDRGGAAQSIVMPSVDALAQTETLTSNYSADYGMNSGATISSAVKSGTTTLHAEAWEFFRNNDLDARNFFNTVPNPVAELRYNVWGFNVGGPVTFGKLYNPDKKKTFFFYNMEWRRLVQGQTLKQLVPSPDEYTGDFGSTAINVPSASLVTAAVLARNCPGDTLPAGIVQGSPFPNNTIPSCMLDPNAQSLLTAGGKYGGIFPQPTAGQGDYFLGGNNLPTNVKEEVVRIDQNFSDKLTVFGHFVADQVAQSYGTTMWSGDNVPSVSNSFGNPSYAAVVHAAYVISPTLVNEVAFNYNGNRIHILPLGLYTAPTDFTFNRYFTGPNVDNRIPSIDLTQLGTDYTSNWMPWNNAANSYQLRDDVSWTKGRHQLKIGGGWMLYKKSQDWFATTQGNFSFNGEYTGVDFADYLLGLSQNYTENAIKSTGQWNNQSWNLYVQDNYRVNNRLTLNLGLRWDGLPHTYEANSQMANFYPNLYSSQDAAILATSNTISTASPGLGPSPNPILAGQQFYVNGISICGQNGTPRGCVNNAWLNFEPRLGFAYDLTGDGKTVIRGGYGIMNERIQGNDVYNNAGTVPLSASINFTNVLLSNPSTNPATGLTVPASIPVNNVTGLNSADYASPRSTQFSLGIQHSIGKSVLSVAYVGAQNRHQNYYTETDLVPYDTLPAYVCQGQSALAGCAGVAAPAEDYNQAVPYVGYHSIKMAQNEANSDYNALQVSFRGATLGNDLTYQVGYTYSHTNDVLNGNNGSGGDLYTISNPYEGWKYDYGPSMFDHQNIFFTNFVYQVPLLKHSDNKLMKTMLGGWEVSGIVTAETGAPLNISVGGQNVASIVPNAANRPNQTGSPNNPHTVQEWFDTSIYSTPAPGTWGDTPPSSVRGPGRQNWNISFFKNFMINPERGTNLQFRAEFFNIWNHPQWVGDEQQGGINTNLSSSGFGQITSAYDPRTIQLALKFYF
jgi:Carboxypeptidase regulatory-like domain/TonB-dependent Receptor Plug Domain